MAETTAAAFLELVAGRRGHFRLESGHHSELWLDLDALFAEPQRIAPFVANLTAALRPYAVSAVCGPLLGGAFLAQLIAHALEVEFYFTERVMPPHTEGLYQARYRLPPAFAARIRGKRLAIVDDVMSAGSALQGTYAELQAHGGEPVVAGALLVLGSTGADFFAQCGVWLEAVARDDYELWLPAECPLCAAGRPLEEVAAPAADPGLAEFRQLFATLDAALRSIATRPVDINRANWQTEPADRPHPLDEAGVRNQAEDLVRHVIDAYAVGDERTRRAVRELFLAHPSFAWAASLPLQPGDAASVRRQFIHFSILDQGRDPRDAVLWLEDLCVRSKLPVHELAQIRRDVAAMSNAVDRYGFGSTAKLLMEGYGSYGQSSAPLKEKL